MYIIHLWVQHFLHNFFARYCIEFISCRLALHAMQFSFLSFGNRLVAPPEAFYREVLSAMRLRIVPRIQRRTSLVAFGSAEGKLTAATTVSSGTRFSSAVDDDDETI